MTKEELISKIASQAGLEEDEVARIIKIFIKEIKDRLDRNETVDIPGFGNFTVGDQK